MLCSTLVTSSGPGVPPGNDYVEPRPLVSGITRLGRRRGTGDSVPAQERQRFRQFLRLVALGCPPPRPPAESCPELRHHGTNRRLSKRQRVAVPPKRDMQRHLLERRRFKIGDGHDPRADGAARAASDVWAAAAGVGPRASGRRGLHRCGTARRDEERRARATRGRPGPSRR